MNFLSQTTKNSVSILELGRNPGVSDNTAWLLKHKLLQALRERDPRYWLAGTMRT